MVLIVEDDESLLRALSMKFNQAEGITFMHAGDGEMGYDLALSSKPALVITDVMMPIMDGIAMLHKLRDHPEGRSIPAIVFTNMGHSEREQEVIELGADYLVKSSTSLQALMDLIYQKLESGG